MGDPIPVTTNRMLPGGAEWVIGADGTLTFESGATVVGLNTSATFASEAEAKAGTLTTKEISPETLRAALVDYQPLADAECTIGTESAHKRNVAIQFEDANDANLAARAGCMAYLSDDANGDSVAATAPDGAVGIGTDGLAIELVTKKAWHLISESNGHIDINITNSTAKTFYLIVVLPSGKLAPSGAITFAG